MQTKARIVVTLLLAVGCTELEAPEARRDRRDGIGSDAVAQKKFRSDEFRCADEQTLRLAPDVTYDDDIAPFLSANCTGCHKSGGTSPDLSSYDKASSAADQSLDAMASGSMPKSGALPDEDIDLFAAWIDGGLLESATGGDTTEEPEVTDETGVGRATCAVPSDFEPSPPTDDTPPPASDPNVPPSSDPPPAGGGSAPPPPSGTPPTTGAVSYQKDVKPILESQCVSCHSAGVQNPDLSTYDAAKASGSRVSATVTGGSMPPGGPLDQASKDIIKKWQDGGFGQ